MLQGDVPMTKVAIDYKKFFHSLSTAYVVFAADDPKFTILEETEAHAEIAMVQRKNVIGKSLFEALPDTSESYDKTGVSQLVESIRKVIKTGEADEMPCFKYDLKDASGQLIQKFWSVTHHPIKDEKGRVTAVYQATEDITDEMINTSKLEQAERRLEQALSSGSIGTWLWDIPGNKVIADKSLARMFGLDEAESTRGLPLDVFTNAIHVDDRAGVKKEITKALKTRKQYVCEYRTMSHDGSTRWVMARGQIEGEDKKSQLFPGVAVDITERKNAEGNLAFLLKASSELASSLDYKKTLVTIADLAVSYVTDWCSIEMLDEYGQLQQVAIAHKDPKKVKWAKELRKRQGPPDLDAPSGVPNVLRTGEPEYYAEITDEMLAAAAKDDQELKLLRDLGLFSYMVAPLKVEGKTIGAITLIASDMKRHYTPSDLDMVQGLANRAALAIHNAGLYESAQREIKERKQLQRQLEEVNDDLEARVAQRTSALKLSNLNLQRSNHELEDFAYVASHDLQEPLRKIQAFSNLLEDEYAKQLGEGADYLTRMRKAAARMSVLIDDLLTFSRVTTKSRDFSSVNLTEVARDVVDDLETRIADTNGKVDIGTLPTIMADPLQMRQLFQNLIANALKFHREGVPPVVSISAIVHKDPEMKKRHAVLTIEDNGVGFEEKYLDRIFAVFQRLHDREAYEGTGIGLAVCRKIIERHSGTITATSKPGKGSTFIVTLPLKHEGGTL